MKVGNDNDWASITAGTYHVLAIKKNGTLWAWGSNSFYQINGSATSTVLSPAEISADTDWVSVEATTRNSFALKRDHTLWAWGNNDAAQLGTGSVNTLSEPTKIAGKWLKVSAGYAFTVALSIDSTLWAWGDNSVGQLGSGSGSSSLVPVQVNSSKWIDIAAGFGFAMGIKKDHSLWSWGYNGNGQLGNADTIKFIRSPMQIGTEKNWERVYAGPVFSYAKQLNQYVYSWGFNYYGQLGLGNTQTQYTPQLVTEDTDWVDIAPAHAIYNSNGVFGNHVFILKSNGELCAAGWNKYGQLGMRDYVSLSSFICGVQTGILKISRRTDIKLYPNPTSDYVSVRMPQTATSDYKIAVYNSLGALMEVAVSINLDNFLIDARTLSAGSYYVVITGRNSFSSAQFFRL